MVELEQARGVFVEQDYRCGECDVEGFGEMCWCCGRSDTLLGRRVPLHAFDGAPPAWGPSGSH